MKGFTTAMLVAATLLSTPCLAARSTLIDRTWAPVSENHAELEHDGRHYVLDTYIVMFQQPYYIHVRAKDGKPLDAAALVGMASDYITPRGCTEPLQRRSDLDRSSGDGTDVVLGFQC